MRGFFIHLSRGWLLLLLVGLGVLLAGCATEPENASARPWNQPRGWETGLPPAMYEGR
jgi:hypothetical protein